MNFNLSCGQVLQKYDLERDEARAKFDLQRDEALRKFIASIVGVKLQDAPRKTRETTVSDKKQTMTRQDIMREYGK